METKFVNENIEDILKGKSKEEILGDKDIIEFRSITLEQSAGRTSGTFLLGEINTSYKKLEKLFGPSIEETDGYKISTRWIVEDDSGNVCTIYDYKATNMFDGYGYTIREFRALSNYNWHLGGKSKTVVDDLIMFIASKIYWDCDES